MPTFKKDPSISEAILRTRFAGAKANKFQTRLSTRSKETVRRRQCGGFLSAVIMREIPPLMELSEETIDKMMFQFRGRRWAVTTLIPGVILTAIVIKLFASGNQNMVILSIVGLFGVLLIYSSIFSFTANQWLIADGRTKTIKFHKDNIYGLVDWEKSANEFKEIRVWKSIRSTSWKITLICNDGYYLQIGENIFGALDYEKALEIANKVSYRTGIRVNA